MLNGSLPELKSVVIDAAQMAFPDETQNISIDENGNTTILREWFWRGDTLITVFIENRDNDEYIINVESEASWHRLNPSGHRYFKFVGDDDSTYIIRQNTLS